MFIVQQHYGCAVRIPYTSALPVSIHHNTPTTTTTTTTTKSLQSCPTLCNPMDCSLPGKIFSQEEKVKMRL